MDREVPNTNDESKKHHNSPRSNVSFLVVVVVLLFSHCVGDCFTKIKFESTRVHLLYSKSDNIIVNETTYMKERARAWNIHDDWCFGKLTMIPSTDGSLIQRIPLEKTLFTTD